MRIFRELLELIGFFTAFAGILIGMFDCYGLELQFRSMVIALVTFLVGCSVSFIGSQLPESVKK